MSIYSNDNISKIAKLTLANLSFYLSIYPSILPTTNLGFVGEERLAGSCCSSPTHTIYLSIYLSIFLSIHPSFQQLTLVLLVKRGLLVAAAPAPLTPIYLSIHLSWFCWYLAAAPAPLTPIYLSFFLSFYLSIHPSNN